jgi:hypothetical protein
MVIIFSTEITVCWKRNKICHWYTLLIFFLLRVNLETSYNIQYRVRSEVIVHVTNHQQAYGILRYSTDLSVKRFRMWADVTLITKFFRCSWTISPDQNYPKSSGRHAAAVSCCPCCSHLIPIWSRILNLQFKWWLPSNLAKIRIDICWIFYLR